MSACEWCWDEASKIVLLLGGSVSERYAELIKEQDKLGKDARCPVVRDWAITNGQKISL